MNKAVTVSKKDGRTIATFHADIDITDEEDGTTFVMDPDGILYPSKQDPDDIYYEGGMWHMDPKVNTWRIVVKNAQDLKLVVGEDRADEDGSFCKETIGDGEIVFYYSGQTINSSDEVKRMLDIEAEKTRDTDGYVPGDFGEAIDMLVKASEEARDKKDILQRVIELEKHVLNLICSRSLDLEGIDSRMHEIRDDFQDKIDVLMNTHSKLKG